MQEEQRHQSGFHGFANFIGESLSRFLASLVDPVKLRKLARLFFLICLGLIVLIWAIFGSTLRCNFVSRKAHSLLKHDRIDEAISRFQAALKIKPQSADAHNNLGVALFEKPERLEEALTELRTAVEINPRHTRAYFHIGNILFEKQQFDEAIAAYRKQLEIDPHNTAIHFKLGKAFQQKGAFDDAIAQFQKVIGIEPKNVRAHYQLANSFFQKGELSKAIAQYEITVNGRPKGTEARARFGLALLHNDQIPEAIMQWKKTVELEPDNIDIRNQLGLVLLQAKQVNEAVDQWQKVLEIHADDIKARLNLAWVFATSPEKSIRDCPRALALAEQAQQLAGHDDPVVLRTLAAAFAECGKFPEAIIAAQQGLALSTTQKQSELIRSLQSEVALYQLNLPCRDKQPGSKGWP